MEPGERVTLEELAELHAALRACEPEVQVEHHDAARVPLLAHVRARADQSALLTPSDAQIDVMDVGQRIAAENGVAVPASAEAMLGPIGDVRHLERFAEEPGLI